MSTEKSVKAAVVFGGAGFIGHHLLKALAESHSYESLVSADIRKPRYLISGVKYVHCDVREEIPTALCPGVTEIYNLAAVHTTPGHADWEYYWTNVMGAANVCHYAMQTNASFIVFTSSISVYGASESPKSESSSLKPDSAYGRSKLAAERIHVLWQSERPNERRLVTVRPAVIYGFGENGNFTRLSRSLRSGLFVYPGRRDTIKACGYVEDLVASVLWARDRAESILTYNFCHPERYTLEQICASFAEVGKYRKPHVTIPLSLMLVCGTVFEALSALGFRTSLNRARVLKLNRSTNIVPERLRTLGFPYRYDLADGLRRWRTASSSTDFE
jgi:nucleoside-diphosphate-sugar epimerase